MASGVGTATINFGAFPGSNEASVAVTGQTAISGTSNAEAFFMDDSTSDHTSADHLYAPTFIDLACGVVTAGTGFTIYARSPEKAQGTFLVRWVWSD